MRNVRQVIAGLAAISCVLMASIGQASPGDPPAGTQGRPAKPSPLARNNVLVGEYRMLRRVADIPAAVRNALGGASFEMAEPGEPFQETDVVSRGRRLPSRRLIFAGCSAAKCFVHYEKGGRGHGYFVVVFSLDSSGGATRRWAGVGGRAALDVSQLRSMVSAGQFADDVPFRW